MGHNNSNFKKMVWSGVVGAPYFGFNLSIYTLSIYIISFVKSIIVPRGTFDPIRYTL